MHRTRSRTDGRTNGHFITIKTKSEVKVKVTVTRKWYETLPHPKMHPHTKFGIPTSKNKGDMHRTQSGRDGQTVRLLYASQSSFGGIKTSTKSTSHCAAFCPADHVFCFVLPPAAIRVSSENRLSPQNPNWPELRPETSVYSSASLRGLTPTCHAWQG